MARQESAESLSIDTMLRGLANKPNVQSTLILSRKDGSIIKATGHISPEEEMKRPKANDLQSFESKEMDGTSKILTEDQNTDIVQEKQPSELETFANAVYQFVGAASLLGTTLNAVESASENYHEKRGQDRKDEQVTDPKSAYNHEDSELQLLRMRIKRQEVIIFPDPNYLCCVVQSTEKSSR